MEPGPTTRAAAPNSSTATTVDNSSATTLATSSCVAMAIVAPTIQNQASIRKPVANLSKMSFSRIAASGAIAFVIRHFSHEAASQDEVLPSPNNDGGRRRAVKNW